MDTRNGVAAVVAGAIEADPAGEAEQLTFRDVLGLRETAVAAANEVARARGAGRPPGARNKRTMAWREHILARFQSPLLTLAAMQAAPVEEIAAALGCTRLEAWAEKRHAAVALAPYLHERLTPETQTTNTMVHLTIGGAAPAVSGAAAEAVEVLEYQEVGDATAGDV